MKLQCGTERALRFVAFIIYNSFSMDIILDIEFCFPLVWGGAISPGVHKVWDGGNFIPRHIYQPAGTFDKMKQRNIIKF